DEERRLVLLDALDRVALEDELPVGRRAFSLGTDGGHETVSLPGAGEDVRMRADQPAGGWLAAGKGWSGRRAPSRPRAGTDAAGGGGWGWGWWCGACSAPSLDILRVERPARVWHLARGVGAGCRGVSGPVPSASLDVERGLPAPVPTLAQGSPKMQSIANRT